MESGFESLLPSHSYFIFVIKSYKAITSLEIKTCANLFDGNSV